jgi:hypothetical protein
MIAAASAVLQAIQTWLQYRDRKETTKSFDSSFKQRQEDPATKAEAETLVNLVPVDILGMMTNRVDACWKHFRQVIDPNSQYLDPQIDEQTEAVKRCICRELRRLYQINKSIPPGQLQLWWNEYCFTKPTK